jgi:hypothetical protein
MGREACCRKTKVGSHNLWCDEKKTKVAGPFGERENAISERFKKGPGEWSLWRENKS